MHDLKSCPARFRAGRLHGKKMTRKVADFTGKVMLKIERSRAQSAKHIGMKAL
jgi:hypothetical protein